MNPIYIAVIWSVLLLLAAFYIFLYLFNMKLNQLEYKILDSFAKRTNIIPGLFEITRDVIVKHDQVFAQSLNLRKEEFAKLASEDPLFRFIELEVIIHKELNFLYKVCSKHPKMMKNWKFVYLRDLLIDRSSEIWTYLEKYKIFIKKYNLLITIKDFTLVWFFVPLRKKTEL